MVHQNVAGRDGGEQRRGVLVETGGGQRRPGGVAQFRQGQAADFEQGREVDFFRHVVDVRRRQPETGAQHLFGPRVGAGAELKPHHRFITALPDLFAHLFAESLGRIVIVVAVGLRVPGQPHQGGGGQLHAAVQAVRVAPDHFVQRYEEPLPGSEIGAERDPLFQHAGNLHPRVDRFIALGVAEEKGERCGEVGEERERMRGIDDERRERRRETVLEVVRGLRLLRGGQFVPVAQEDTVSGERGDQFVAKAVRLPAQQREQSGAKPADKSLFLVGLSLPEHRDALHEKFVQVGSKNSQKLSSLEQRSALIERFGQHSLVEVEPTQIAIDPDGGKTVRQ